jgi:aminopeptidase N
VALNFEQQKRIPIHDIETEDLFQLLNANNYQKGAWVLHMLRSQLGDELFFRGIREFYATHQGSIASSEDLRVALEHASGLRLDAFFKSWIYGTGHPVYDVSWHWNEQRRVLRVRLRQDQPEPVFPNWLPLVLSAPTYNHTVLMKPSTKDFVQEFPLEQAPDSVTIDPDNTVLKEIFIRGGLNNAQ